MPFLLPLVLHVWVVLLLSLSLPALLGARAPRSAGPLFGFVAMGAGLLLPQLLLGELLALGLALGHGSLLLSVEVATAGLPLSICAWRVHRGGLRKDGLPWDPPWPALARSRLWWAALRLGAPGGSGVERRTLRGWRSGPGWSLDLTLYQPKDRQGALPGLVFLHGGAWLTGNRQQNWYYCSELAARGFVVASVSYRKAPGFTLSDIVTDARAAVVWLRQNATEHGVDPHRIALLGSSAGGHLAALVALTPDDRSSQTGLPEADCSVRAVVSFYGVADLLYPTVTRPHALVRLLLERWVVQQKASIEPDLYRRLSPVHRAEATAPPMLLVHGDADAIVPVKESRRFERRLREVGAAVTLVEVEGAGHAFTIHPSPTAGRVVALVADFLQEALAEGPYPASPPSSASSSE